MIKVKTKYQLRRLKYNQVKKNRNMPHGVKRGDTEEHQKALE